MILNALAFLAVISIVGGLIYAYFNLTIECNENQCKLKLKSLGTSHKNCNKH